MSIDWNAEQATSTNPFKRFLQYREAKAIKKNMNEILQSHENISGKNRKYLWH